ncbi:hypothetical protein [Nostoc sp.]|uniref:hypothetical protein n=1 Tax=Nostoc sp. TaxID=1180 RepID=UPI002FFBBEDA
MNSNTLIYTLVLKVLCNLPIIHREITTAIALYPIDFLSCERTVRSASLFAIWHYRAKLGKLYAVVVFISYTRTIYLLYKGYRQFSIGTDTVLLRTACSCFLKN